MLSEELYMEAEVFLRDYRRAVSNIEEIIKRDKDLQRYQMQEHILTQGLLKGQFRAVKGQFQVGKNFKDAYLFKVKNYSQEIISRYFGNLSTAKNFAQIKQNFDKGSEAIRKEL